MIASLLAFGSLAGVQTKPISLLELPQRYSLGYMRLSETPLRLSNVTAAYGLYSTGSSTTAIPASSVSYVVPKGIRYLRGVIGLKSDAKPAKSKPLFRLLLDGKLVYERALAKTDPAKRISVTLNGAKVVTFQLDAAVGIGDPIFAQDSTSEAKPADVKPLLLEPESGARVVEDRILLSWQPLTGATAYAVELVVTKLEAPDAGIQKAYLYNVLGGATSFRLDLAKMPPGSLRWSVIAFNDEGRLGKFSEDRLLVRE